jgi:hypothetical protein
MNTFDQVLAPSHLKVDVIEPVSFDKFQREYNATCTPVLINGLAANWSANQHWKIDQLLEKASTQYDTFKHKHTYPGIVW